MKKLVYFSLFALVFIGISCKLESLSYYDDVYSSNKEIRSLEQSQQQQKVEENSYTEYQDNTYTQEYSEPTMSETISTTDASGNTYVTNNLPQQT